MTGPSSSLTARPALGSAGQAALQTKTQTLPAKSCSTHTRRVSPKHQGTTAGGAHPPRTKDQAALPRTQCHTRRRGGAHPVHLLLALPLPSVVVVNAQNAEAA